MGKTVTRGGGERPFLIAREGYVMPRLDVIKPRITEAPASLLMISHCVPQPEGSVDRVAAWDLLNEAASLGVVYLACLYDGPVSLTQWRRLTWLAEVIVLEYPSLKTRLLRYISEVRAVSTAAEDLRPLISIWQREMLFNAVICTRPAFEGMIQPHTLIPPNTSIGNESEPISIPIQTYAKAA